MWLMLQQEIPDDYVLATGETHTVRSFVEKAFAKLDIAIEWRGEGVDEKGYDKASGRLLIEVDPRYFRPTEVELLIGNPAKAHRQLGWKHEINLDQLVGEMVEQDFKSMQSKTFNAQSNPHA